MSVSVLARERNGENRREREKRVKVLGSLSLCFLLVLSLLSYRLLIAHFDDVGSKVLIESSRGGSADVGNALEDTSDDVSVTKHKSQLSLFFPSLSLAPSSFCSSYYRLVVFFHLFFLSVVSLSRSHSLSRALSHSLSLCLRSYGASTGAKHDESDSIRSERRSKNEFLVLPRHSSHTRQFCGDSDEVSQRRTLSRQLLILSLSRLLWKRKNFFKKDQNRKKERKKEKKK
jgi:hypothetical protein